MNVLSSWRRADTVERSMKELARQRLIQQPTFVVELLLKEFAVDKKQQPTSQKLMGPITSPSIVGAHEEETVKDARSSFSSHIFSMKHDSKK